MTFGSSAAMERQVGCMLVRANRRAAVFAVTAEMAGDDVFCQPPVQHLGGFGVVIDSAFLE